MTWTKKFRKPIFLKNGRAIATLADARAFMVDLPNVRASRPLHALSSAPQLARFALPRYPQEREFRLLSPACPRSKKYRNAPQGASSN
jgi:hypothetical protein